MNFIDRDLPIHNTEESAVRRDKQLVRAAHAGLQGAFSEFNATYSSRLYSTIFAITRNPEDAECAPEDTFLRVHLGLRTFDGKCGIYIWLTRIAINSVLTIILHLARPETLFASQSGSQEDTPSCEVKDSHPNPEEICEWRQRSVRVLHAIRRLDPPLQAPIRMQMTNGSSIESSIEEIGRVVNISQAAVKARLHRARRRFFIARDVNVLSLCARVSISLD
jgi:RNA polymerase sigma-70 factor (ECF subfamily)